MRWLDGFPLPLLIVLALWMGVAPVYPEPHLVEKVRLLMTGELTRPLDVFDLLFHLAPAGLLVWRLVRRSQQRRPPPAASAPDAD